MDWFFKALKRELPLIHSLLTDRLAFSLCAVAVFFMAMQWGFYAVVLVTAENLVTTFGLIVGGDFTAFHEAGKTPSDARIALYEFEDFNARLAESFPARTEPFGLAWQYPPTMFLLTTPFGAMPYTLAYAVWVLGGASLFLFALSRAGVDRLSLLIVAASPALFQTVITGQTGMFTGTLFFLACFAPDKRPVIAGLAAGLLTLKPQLGVLIPIAFIACGAWRAFTIAAVVSITIALSAYTLFGADLWAVFIEAASAQGERMGLDVFPVHKLTSPFGGALTIGLPNTIASAIQLTITLGLILLIVFVWRRTKSREIRFAVTACASVLAAPYVFYYELPIVVAGLVMLLQHARKTGIAPYEGLSFAVLWLAPIFMPGAHSPSIPLVFIASVMALCIALRRFLIEHSSGRAARAHSSGDRALVKEVQFATDGHALR